MIYQVDYRTRKLLSETGIPVFYASQIVPYSFQFIDEAGEPLENRLQKRKHTSNG